MVAIAWRHAAGAAERWRQRAPITEGVSGRVISTGALVVDEDYQNRQVGSQLAPMGTRAIIGVPLYDRGRVIGSLVAGTQLDARRFSPRDRELISAYGEHISAALAVARASEAMQQAFTDSLTGLGNRALMLDRLEHELVRADRGGRPATVLFLDLDRFKLVNDSLGHLAGDELLIAAAKRLRGCTRKRDVCARLGGDEFAVLLVGAADPAALAERIINALQRPFNISGQEVFISASIGIASGRGEGEELLRNADVAMYHAKRGGSGRYEHFEPSMHAQLVSRLGVDTELRRALERDEFELHYQPMFDLGSGEIVMFEGLIRWRHPVRGLVAPLDFVPVAEENGLILEIGRWVLGQACSQLAAWRRREPLAMSVNVSMRELREPDYAAAVEAAIGDTLPPSALILEVTERVPPDDAAGVLASLHAVKELGVRVALDDFGTGYSSLINLSHLPVDMIKVASPFLERLEHGSGKQSGLLAGIVGLGRHLGLMTVAEGIERPDQLALLVELGCELGQGYLLGRPVDAEHTGRLLKSGRARQEARQRAQRQATPSRLPRPRPTRVRPSRSRAS
jgi:diguanylate cyclase (GGDEF)-like protein